MTYNPSSKKPTGFRLLSDRNHSVLLKGRLHPITAGTVIPYDAIEIVLPLNEEEVSSVSDALGYRIDPKNWCIIHTRGDKTLLIHASVDRFVNVWDSV